MEKVRLLARKFATFGCFSNLLPASKSSELPPTSFHGTFGRLDLYKQERRILAANASDAVMHLAQQLDVHRFLHSFRDNCDSSRDSFQIHETLQGDKQAAASLMSVGRVAALRHGMNDSDLHLAYRIYSWIYEEYGCEAFLEPEDVPTQMQHSHVYAWTCLAVNEVETLQLALEYFSLDPYYAMALRCDLTNPNNESRVDGVSTWLSHVGSLTGLPDLGLVENKSTNYTFNDLQAPQSPAVSGRLVSIVMTAFRPDAKSLMHAVTSILRQEYQTWELLLVDDGSGSDFSDLFQEIGKLDNRIMVMSMDCNHGTYRCRNVALARARGEFITFHDSDDWSHPRRLSWQVQQLQGNTDGSVVAVHCRSIRLNDQLLVSHKTMLPTRINASSLMLTREAFSQVGYFLPVRRGADTEYLRRLTLAFPDRVIGYSQSVKEADIPVLTCVRLRSNSLSSGDFGVGYVSFERRELRTAYDYWHRQLGRTRNWYLPPLDEAPFRVAESMRLSSLTDLRFSTGITVNLEGHPGKLASLAAFLNANGAEQAGIALIPLGGGHGKVRQRELLRLMLENPSVHLVYLSDEVTIENLIAYDPWGFRPLPPPKVRLRAQRILALKDDAMSCDDRRDIEIRISNALGQPPVWMIEEEINPFS